MQRRLSTLVMFYSLSGITETAIFAGRALGSLDRMECPPLIMVGETLPKVMSPSHLGCVDSNFFESYEKGTMISGLNLYCNECHGTFICPIFDF